LINYLKVTTLEVDATGGIDSMTLGLVMALLYALDFSILQRREDGESKSSVVSLNVIPSLTVRTPEIFSSTYHELTLTCE
jgi:hypothetical protein